MIAPSILWNKQDANVYSPSLRTSSQRACSPSRGLLWKTSSLVRQKLTACRERRCVCLKVRVAVASSCHYLHCSTSETNAVTAITICTCGVCLRAASAAGWGSLMSASTIGGSVCTTSGSVVKPLPLPEPLSSSPDVHKQTQIQYNNQRLTSLIS